MYVKNVRHDDVVDVAFRENWNETKKEKKVRFVVIGPIITKIH